MFLLRYCDSVPHVFYQHLFLGLLSVTVFVHPPDSATCSDVTKEVFESPPTTMGPIAIGDFNNDRMMDTVFLSKNQSFFQVYFGSETIPFLQPWPEYGCDISYLDSVPVKIVAISVADVDGDGLIDVIVTIDKGEYVDTYIFRGNPSRLDCRDNNLIRFLDSNHLRLKQEPLIIDANSDTIADILVENPAGGRDIWIFTHRRQNQVISLSCNSSEKCLPLSKPHCSAFADLDSDFSPEVIIVSTEPSSGIHHLELFAINGGVSTQYLDQVIKIGNFTPQRIGSLIVMDFNQLGHTVLVIPYCTDLNCHESGLMVYEKETNRFTKLDVQFHNWNFLIPDSTTPYSESIHLRVADFDLDGYPDLIGTLVKQNTTQSQSVVFLNVPCSAKICKYNRTFSLNFDDLSEYDHPVNALLYDFYDDGLLDVLIVSLDETQKDQQTKEMGVTYKIRVWRNTPKYDGYFLKTMMCGRCQAPHCPGIAVPGASLKYQRGLTKGKIALLYRSYALDFPLIIAGTGSSPNFIDEVTVGRSPFVKSWKQIIPNSFLLVYQNDRGSWQLKHYLSVQPKGAIETLIFLLIWLVVTAGLVVFFSIKERKEDRRNNVQSGSLNFIRLS